MAQEAPCRGDNGREAAARGGKIASASPRVPLASRQFSSPTPPTHPSPQRHPPGPCHFPQGGTPPSLIAARPAACQRRGGRGEASWGCRVEGGVGGVRAANASLLRRSVLLVWQFPRKSAPPSRQPCREAVSEPLRHTTPRHTDRNHLACELPVPFVTSASACGDVTAEMRHLWQMRVNGFKPSATQHRTDMCE